MKDLAVGQAVAELAGRPDQAMIEISQGRILLMHLLQPRRARALAGGNWGASFKIFRDGAVVILLSRMGEGPWLEAVCAPGGGLIPARAREIGDAITWALCETGAGEVLAVRDIALPVEFGDALRAALNEQAERIDGPEAIEDDLERVFMRYNTDGLVRRAKAGCEVAAERIAPLASTGEGARGGRTYAGLPAELEAFYAYLDGAGHTLYAIPESLRAEMAGDAADNQVPLPARFVLERGYRLENGLLFCDVEYDPQFGALVPEGYDEY